MTGRTRLYGNLNLLLLMALFAGSAWAYPRLPERIPIHFGVSGEPDRWATRSALSWFFLPIIAAAVALFLHLASTYSARHPELWNLPGKRRFLALDEVRQAPIIAAMQEFMALIGVMVTALMSVIHASVYSASRSPEPQMPLWMLGAIGLWLLVLAIFAVRLNARVSRMIDAAEMGEQPAGV